MGSTLSKVYNTEFYLFSENKLIFILLFAYILRLGLGLGKLRYLPGGPGGLPPGLGFGFGVRVRCLGKAKGDIYSLIKLSGVRIFLEQKI